jgi:RNA polymerase sigma-70 factor (ECF subfamily)
VAEYLRRRVGPLPQADVDDLVNETFLVCWRRLGDVPAGESERPWVIGVARNVLHNAHRAASRRRRHEGRVRPYGPSASAEDEAMSDVAAREALARLTSADQELLTLHYWDNVDVEGIALALHLSPNAAGTRLSRAKSRFLANLAPPDERGTAGGSADREEREAT